MSGKTAGQLLHESLCETAVAEFDMPIEAFDTWDQMRESQRKRMETAATAVETGQVRLAREDRDQLRKQVLDLAAKWDATADRNQRNGQSLIDQGDEYGSEGLAVAEALGACVVELRAVLADAPEPQPAPDLGTAWRLLNEARGRAREARARWLDQAAMHERDAARFTDPAAVTEFSAKARVYRGLADELTEITGLPS